MILEKKTSRREFLKGLFATGATIALAPLVPNIPTSHILDDLNAITLKVIKPQIIADNFFKTKSPMLSYLRGMRPIYDGGKELSSPFIYDTE